MKKDDFFTEEMYQVATKPTNAANTPEIVPNPNVSVVVVATYSDSLQMPDTDYAFLQKILEAVKINLQQQAAIINLAQSPEMPTFRHWRNAYKPAYILSFGIEAKEWRTNISLLPYIPVFFNDIHLLNADALSVIAADQSKKMQLWQALKLIFTTK